MKGIIKFKFRTNEDFWSIAKINCKKGYTEKVKLPPIGGVVI